MGRNQRPAWERGRGDHGGGSTEHPEFRAAAGHPELGRHAEREGRQHLEIASHLALRPGVCLAVVVYSLNMFGDAVRDLLDLRQRGRLGRYGAGRE